ncbi:MAG: aminotransferase class V-fold PLP-dependent enzyme [Pseudomonadota bacterium]
MGIFREIPPTAGFPLGLRNFFLSAGKSNESLQNSVKKYLNLPYAEITCSGTGALYLIMETIKDLSPKRTVIIPSFICPLVPLAIKRAGFNIKVCDIGTHDFNYNYSQLETLCTQDNDIVAVIACHLAGIPIDLQSLLSLTKNKNIFLIEDAAQALGSSYQGRPVGTWGDFALFSLCRGKGMTLYEGGVVATNNEYYGHFLDKKFKEIIKFDFLTEAKRLFELLGYALFYRPLLFWGVFKLPQLYWEMRGNKIKALGEDFAINFPLHGVSQMRKSIGQSQFHSLENRSNWY